MSDQEQYHVLMVCLGNICRSPLAAGLLHFAAESKGLDEHLYIDSAGTSGEHAGEKPDPRALKVAEDHGFQLNHEARPFSVQDFEDFDEILVMDDSNLKNVLKLAQTPAHKAKVKLITEYDPRKDKPKNVPDPYYGNQEQFEEVYEQLWYCCMGFLKQVSA